MRYTEQEVRENEEYTFEQIWKALRPFLDGAKLDEGEQGEQVIKYCRMGRWYTIRVERD